MDVRIKGYRDRIMKILEGGAISEEELNRRVRISRYELLKIMDDLIDDEMARCVQLNGMRGYARAGYTDILNRPWLTPDGMQLLRELEGRGAIPRWGKLLNN